MVVSSAARTVNGDHRSGVSMGVELSVPPPMLRNVSVLCRDRQKLVILNAFPLYLVGDNFIFMYAQYICTVLMNFEAFLFVCYGEITKRAVRGAEFL
jgi:hypothetical protein